MPLPVNNIPHKTPVIEFENVSFSYSNTQVLQNVSFKIYSGESVGMIGPNGGGKTTLLKLILGFLHLSSGTIKVFGSSLRDDRISPNKIAYVPQSVRFDRDFPISVEEVVLAGLLSKLPWYGKFHTKEKEAAREALKKIGLSHLSEAPFGSLSGGQAQRVLIARALVSQPQLLLLDEPTASVDSRAEADIYALLKELKGEMTILMVTHDLEIAVKQVGRLLCVQGDVRSLNADEVCHHFSLGLYTKEAGS